MDLFDLLLVSTGSEYSAIVVDNKNRAQVPPISQIESSGYDVLKMTVCWLVLDANITPTSHISFLSYNPV